MAIHFSNAGHLDLDVIRTMGVSVKVNDNPIGFFGTGLKYAIATLLRTGHIISLRTNGETLQFRTKTKEIRGKEFQMIMMDDEQLGFTTDLGRNWEVWQAYRELYSNCMDEKGTVSGIFVENDTIFSVEGPEIAEVHAERAKIFLHGEPWIVREGLEIHRGKSWYVFYRGVRVVKLPVPSRFTYNITTSMKLTEDRTFASEYDMNYKLSTRIPTIADPEFCSAVTDWSKDNYEQNLNFLDCWEPSEEFLDALEKHVDNAHMKENARNLLKRCRKVDTHVPFTPSEQQLNDIEQACEMIKVLNCYVKPENITFVEHLGPNVYGQAKDGKILITRQTVSNGVDFLAITIYEEWIHDKLGLFDESRGMQQFLFDKILELIKRDQ